MRRSTTKSALEECMTLSVTSLDLEGRVAEEDDDEEDAIAV